MQSKSPEFDLFQELTTKHRRVTVKFLPSFSWQFAYKSLSKTVVTVSPTPMSSPTTTTTMPQWNHLAQALWLHFWNPVHGRQISTQNEAVFEKRILRRSSLRHDQLGAWIGQRNLKFKGVQNIVIQYQKKWFSVFNYVQNHCGNRLVLLICCSWYLIWFSTSWDAFQDTVSCAYARPSTIIWAPDPRPKNVFFRSGDCNSLSILFWL